MYSTLIKKLNGYYENLEVNLYKLDYDFLYEDQPGRYIGTNYIIVGIDKEFKVGYIHPSNEDGKVLSYSFPEVDANTHKELLARIWYWNNKTKERINRRQKHWGKFIRKS